MACSMSASLTSSMSSTSRLTMGCVSPPGDFTAMPSAMVYWPCGIDTPLTAAYMAGKRSVCTPMISMPGLSALAAVEMPEIRPPPPMAITSMSSCGWSSSISSATVPCPAITASSVSYTHLDVYKRQG